MSDDPVGISFIDLDERVMVLHSGETLPVTTLMNDEGDIITSIALATKCVAGPTKEGRWIASTIDDDDRTISGLAIPPAAARVDRAAGHVWFVDGTVLPIEGWLADDLSASEPESATCVDAGPDPSGYSIRVSLEPRDGLVVIR